MKQIFLTPLEQHTPPTIVNDKGDVLATIHYGGGRTEEEVQALAIHLVDAYNTRFQSNRGKGFAGLAEDVAASEVDCS